MPVAVERKSALAKSAGRGLMVAFLLPEDVAQAIAIPGGEPPEDLHMTLCYLGKLEDLAQETVERTLACVQAFTARRPPLAGQISGIGRFDASTTSDGDEVIYASFDSPELAGLREDLVRELEYEGAYPKNDHGFTPHITLAYVKPGEPGPERTLPIALRFDRILVATGDVREEFRLRGRPLEERLDIAKGKIVAEEWAAHWHEAMPRRGHPRAFCVQTKELRKGNAWETSSLLLHFDGPLPWGFGIRGGTFPAPTAAAWPKAPGVPAFRDGSGKRARWKTKGAGTYILGHAAEDAVEVILQGERFAPGRLLFERTGEAWTAAWTEDQAPWAARQELVKSLEILRARGVTRAILPRDPLNLSRGHRLVDVKKATDKLASYRLVKRADEQRFSLGVAYPANSVDAHGEYADAEELEKAAWQFMQDPKVGIMHRFGTEGAGRVVESYVWRFEKTTIGGQVISPGDWLLGVVWEPQAWALIKSGDLNGFSIQGWAARA